MDSTSKDSSPLSGLETYAVVCLFDSRVVTSEETGKRVEAWLISPATGPTATLRGYDLYGDAFVLSRSRMGTILWSTRIGRKGSAQHCQALEDLEAADRKEVAVNIDLL